MIRDILQFPVPIDGNEQIFDKIEQQVSFILSNNEKQKHILERFIKRIESNLSVKMTNKLQNFYDFSFKIFIDELKKQKVNLTLKEQEEWEEYFDSHKKEITDMQQKIAEKDKEIDKNVFQLYNLSNSEIQCIEKGIV